MAASPGLTAGRGLKLEVDVAANIYKAAGVDMLATYRANIGA